MNIKSNEKKENSTIELVIEVTAEEFEAALNKAYNKRKKSIAVPGFRKGKAPRRIIEATYGAEVFYEDAIEESYPEAYSAALKEAGIEPVAFPKLEVLNVGKEGFSFKALVTVKPEVTVKDYKGMSAPKADVKVSAADVKAELKPYIDRASRLVTVERKAKKGDTVVIDFEGFRDGVPFDGGKGENYSLALGSGTFVPGFEDQLIGAVAGDEKDLDITFPEDYAPELAGAAVVFKVKVHEVKEKQEPTLDDEFAKDVSEFETLAEFKKSLSDNLKKRRKEEAEKAFESALIDQLVDKMEGEVPEAMAEYRAERMVDDYAMRIQSQGIPFEQYLSMVGMTANDMRAQAMDSARRMVKMELALEAVAEAEKLEVTEADVDAEIAKMAEVYSRPVEEVRDSIPVEELKGDLLRRKAIELIVKHATVTEEVSEPEGEEKSAKKPAAKKAAKKAEDGEEKSAKKPAAKKAAQKEEE